jgi:hypothetical protein
MRLLIAVLLLNCFVFSELTAQVFTEESHQRGIDHVFKDKVLTGGGAAFFDYDQDGDEDLYLTTGLGRDVLYENDGQGNFNPLYGIGFDITIQYNTLGVSTGDIDNDGYREVFICTWDYRNDLFGPNLLFKNNGDGTFTDISESAGIKEDSYSTSSTFLDYNKDGFLDIYVVNHVKEVVFVHDSTGLLSGYDHKCFENFFYINNGDETFTEMAGDLGVQSIGCGLAAVATDIDFDNDVDLYIANDFGEFVVANEFYENEYPNAHFKSKGAELGMDIGLYGMGIAAGDYDQDLDMDFYVTNIGRNVLIENEAGQFTDVTTSRGVENAKVPAENLNTTSWGTAFLDVNNDTWLDLFVANGRIPALSVNATAMNDPNKLFINNKDKTFSDISEVAGLADERSARGFAYSDIDMDGDLDLYTVVLRSWESDAYSKLYINQLDSIANFVQFKLIGKESNRDAYGAKLWLYVGEQIYLREIYGGGSSYASQSSSVVHYGLGAFEKIDSLKIDWPNGHQQVVHTPAINQRHIIAEDVELSTSTTEKAMKKAWSVHPNPFSQTLRIELPQPINKTAQLKLMTANGQVLMHKKVSLSEATISLETGIYPRGIYFIQLESDHFNWVEKMIKLE